MVNHSGYTQPVILLGAGGHAKVLLSLLQSINFPILGVCAPEFKKQNIEYWRGLKILEERELLDGSNTNSVSLANGIGFPPGDNTRQRIFDKYTNNGYSFPSLVHPKTHVDSTAQLDDSVQVMVGVVIQPDTCIGKNVIINSKASIDHDCIIGDHVHIAPGAVLCGNVQVGRGVFVGSGAILAPGIRVGENACIGAGTSVVRDVPAGQLVIPGEIRSKQIF